MKIYTFLFILFIPLMIYFYSAANTNIHGDSKFHTYFAVESAKKQYLVREQPHRIYNFENARRNYMPIAYPLTSESFFTVLYMYGGENILKYYSVIFSLIIFLYVYLLTRDFGIGISLLISLLSTLAISERLLMSPLIEPYITVILLATVYCIKRFVRNFETGSWILFSFFLAASISIKQQGITIAPIIITFAAFILLRHSLKLPRNRIKYFIFNLALLMLVIITVPYPAIADQIDRTGTFGYSPGMTQLPKSLPLHGYIQPIFESRFPTNPEAMKVLDSTIQYNKQKPSLVRTLRAFILAPFLYHRTSDNNSQQLILSLLICNLLLFTSLLILISKNTNNKTYLVFLFFLSLGEVFLSYALKTPINQYHTFGIVVSVIVFLYSIYKLSSEFTPTRTLIIPALYILSIIGFFNYIFPGLTVSGREDDYHLEGYKRIGNYVKNTTPKDSIFLAPETSFRYYADRDTVWLNESIADVVGGILTNTDDHQIAKDLRQKLFVDYVVINKEQTKRIGVNDYLPPVGLITSVQNSTYFQKIYDPYDDGEMVVYKVNYE